MDIEGVRKYFHRKWKKPSKEKLDAYILYKGNIVPGEHKNKFNYLFYLIYLFYLFLQRIILGSSLESASWSMNHGLKIKYLVKNN